MSFNNFLSQNFAWIQRQREGMWNCTKGFSRIYGIVTWLAHSVLHTKFKLRSPSPSVEGLPSHRRSGYQSSSSHSSKYVDVFLLFLFIWTLTLLSYSFSTTTHTHTHTHTHTLQSLFLSLGGCKPMPYVILVYSCYSWLLMYFPHSSFVVPYFLHSSLVILLEYNLVLFLLSSSLSLSLYQCSCLVSPDRLSLPLETWPCFVAPPKDRVMGRSISISFWQMIMSDHSNWWLVIRYKT
jgi:hypothetical protein